MMGPNPSYPPLGFREWRYASIDIETLGLDPFCDVIEFGAVLEDLLTPVKDLPTFHTYVVLQERECYWGEPYAMAMHSAILKRIAVREEGYTYTPVDLLDEVFANWLKSQGIQEDLVVAGKNFQGFDMKFLTKHCQFGTNFKICHRGLDPGSMFFDPKIDKKPPSLEACLKRAGIEKSVEHTAVADAIDVIRCIRYKYGIE